MYGQIYPFASRSYLGLCPWELLQAEGYIWPYIWPRRVLIMIQFILGEVVGYKTKTDLGSYASDFFLDKEGSIRPTIVSN